jgi:hypothetical protein
MVLKLGHFGKQIRNSFTRSMLRALIQCNFFKETKKYTWMYDCNSITK